MDGEGEILHIKISDIKTAAPHFSAQSVALAQALSKLETGLAAAGSPWGDDDQGKKFNDAYGPLLTQIEQAAQILAEGLASIHLAMDDMADGHIDNEELIRAMFSRTHVTHDTTGDSK